MDRQTRTILTWTAKWTAVFAANVALPLGLLFTGSNGSGLTGVCCALWLVWAEGVVVGSLSSRVRAFAPRAAMFLAALQFAPVIQLTTLVIGLAVGESLVNTVKPAVREVREEAIAFSGIFIAGQLLFGFVLLVVRERSIREQDEPQSPDPK